MADRYGLLINNVIALNVNFRFYIQSRQNKRWCIVSWKMDKLQCERGNLYESLAHPFTCSGPTYRQLRCRGVRRGRRVREGALDAGTTLTVRRAANLDAYRRTRGSIRRSSGWRARFRCNVGATLGLRGTGHRRGRRRRVWGRQAHRRAATDGGVAGLSAAAALHVTVRARCSRLGHRLAVASPSYCLPDDGRAGGARCTAPLHSACPPAPRYPLDSGRPATPAPPRRIFRIGREKSIVQRAPNNFGKTHGALASSRPRRSSALPPSRLSLARLLKTLRCTAIA